MSENLPEEAVKTMTYQDLRRMTECAASYRGAKVWIVIDDKGWTVEKTEPTPAASLGKAVIPCQSPGTPRPKVGYAYLGPDKDQAVDLLDLYDKDGEPVGEADAVFWSAAAVEKFVVPYYASVYGDQAPKEIEKVIKILGTVRDPRNGLEPFALEPFALAHMPKSEYVQVDNTFTVLVNEGGKQYAIPVGGDQKP
jgi:hypothetical protein